MSKRAKTAALKRRLRQNLERETERDEQPSLGCSILFVSGFDIGVSGQHWQPQEEWPDVIGEADAKVLKE